MSDPWTNPYHTEEMELADEAAYMEPGALAERLRKVSDFLRTSVTPPAPIANTVRQSMADVIDDAVRYLGRAEK